MKWKRMKLKVLALINERLPELQKKTSHQLTTLLILVENVKASAS